MIESVGATRAGSATAQTAVQGVLAAIVFREVLKPLASALGPAGDVAVATVVDGMFVRRAP